MRLKKTRQRIHVVRSALTMLTAIYRRDRNLSQMLGRAWSVTVREGLRGVKTRVVLLAHPAQEPAEEPPPALSYDDWTRQFDSTQEADVQAAREHLAALRLPELLIMLVVTRDGLASLERVLASWQTSIHDGWHAALVASPDLSAAELDGLRDRTSHWPRTSIVSTPDEVNALRGRFEHALLCHGPVLLNRLSTYMFVEAAVRTGADIIYSDHDRLDELGSRVDPAFKPQFSPGYVARLNYIGDCLLISRPVALTTDQVNLLLRATLPDHDRFVADVVQGRCVEHLPFVLFHVLGDRPRLPHELPVVEDRGPTVSIIIPTRDGLDHLRPCVESILQRTSYDLKLVEFIIVNNNSSDPAALAYLDELGRREDFTVLDYPHAFNFAAINNLGAGKARGEILVFLNNDTLVHDPAWLSKMVLHAREPDVGVVGAKLLFPDLTIQHGGCAAGANMGTVGHLLVGANVPDTAGSDHTREMSLLTGACWAVRSEVFGRVGGFDPVLRITWNDVKFCLRCLQLGYRNIYVADPLLVHDESRTRGNDDSLEKMTRYLSEAHYTRREFRAYFQDDPSFSPNLSVEYGGGLAAPPRVRRPWSGNTGRPHRILVLSSVYKFGFGVPLVIQQQVRGLLALGHEVIIGGPKAEKEVCFPGCQRVILESAKDAAIHAFQCDASLIISHTPPFFEVPLMIGPHIPVLSYDYGEPSPDFFPEPTRSYLRHAAFQKRQAASLTTSNATISQAVKDETLNDDTIIVGLGNSHLPAWSEEFRPRREQLRRKLEFDGRFVVLTVCRFSENERAYKGLDKVAAILRELPYLHPGSARDVVWVLAGAGQPDDVRQVEALGFSVFPNVPDDVLADLYIAADAYMSFARWEGYNLGISQALAMGLSVAASDIPAHREFPIFTSNSVLAVCNWLAGEIHAEASGKRQRRPVIYDWGRSVSQFVQVVERLLQRPLPPAGRVGASSCREPAPARTVGR